MNKSRYLVVETEEKTRQSGRFLAGRILKRPHWAKTVLLKGDLGAGKTTFINGFAKGLSEKINTKSPSFTIIEEHHFTFNAEEWTLVHVDLYRLGKKTDQEIYAYLQEKITQENQIVVIEWAENLTDSFELPKNRIELNFQHGEKENERIIEPIFFDSGVPSKEEIAQLTQEFKTPKHIIAHEIGVQKVALLLAEGLFKNGIILNFDLVSSAALLHDLVRIVNFPEMKFDNFIEEITEEKIKFWNKIRDKYHDIHHGEVASDILKERGFLSCADVIRKHRSKAIFDELKSFEEKVVYLADKKVLHDQFVKVEERIADGKVRHSSYTEDAQDRLEQGIHALKDELLFLSGFEDENKLDKKLEAK